MEEWEQSQLSNSLKKVTSSEKEVDRIIVKEKAKRFETYL